jgi:tryptophanyl-tRNA synthetase
MPIEIRSQREDAGRIALTGIKPTGTPHIGNYLGMIKPALELVQSYRAFYFIADYHALTTTRSPEELRRWIYKVAAAWLALGLDPERVVFFRQSDIAEVFEFSWILACFAPKGLLNRGHAYKAAVEANIVEGRGADDGINAGLFNYPILMAADILLYDSDVVPVGQDQTQHVEIARDIALTLNSQLGKVLTVPEARVPEDARTIPGIDGRKMSKNYDNTIPIFADPEVTRRQVMRIITDSKKPEDPKDPESCNIFAIWRHFAPAGAVEAKRQLYLRGGLAYSAIKEELVELLESRFGTARQAYNDLLRDTAAIDRIFKRGAVAARAVAQPVLGRVRRKVGIA